MFTNVGIEQLRRALSEAQCDEGVKDNPRKLFLALDEDVSHCVVKQQICSAL